VRFIAGLATLIKRSQASGRRNTQIARQLIHTVGR